MEEIIYSRNNNSTISCYSMDFRGISKQNAHGGRNVMPRCLSEGVDIFLKSAERQGGANRTLPWMATGAVPVRIRTAVSLFNRKFTPGDATSRRDVPFAVGVRGFFINFYLTSSVISSAHATAKPARCATRWEAMWDMLVP